MSTYATLLHTRYVRALLTTNFVGRLPNGSGTVAILLYLTHSGVGYGQAGVATASYGIATAIGSPVLGRIVDRTRQAPVLLASSFAAAAGYLALTVVDPKAHFLSAIACVAVAGLFTPPLEACLRAIWASVLGDARLVHSAFALDSGLQELIFIVGPLLASGTAAAINPSFGLIFVTVLSLGGTIAYCLVTPVGRWRAAATSAASHEPVRWWGPLGRLSVSAILISFLFIGATIGILNLTAVAYSDDTGSAARSGIVLGANALGALIGGIAYGRKMPTSAAIDHLPALCGALLLCYLPVAAISIAFSPGLLAICAAVFLAGIPLAPTIAAAFAALSTQTIPGTETEVFAWLVSMMLLGNAAGAAIAGVLIADRSWSWGAAVIAVPLVVAVAATFVARQHQVAPAPLTSSERR